MKTRQPQKGKNKQEQIDETKSQLLEKINKTDKSLVRLTNIKREKTEPPNIKNETKAITTDPKPVNKKNQGILQLYAHKFENLD